MKRFPVNNGCRSPTVEGFEFQNNKTMLVIVTPATWWQITASRADCRLLRGMVLLWYKIPNIGKKLIWQQTTLTCIHTKEGRHMFYGCVCGFTDGEFFSCCCCCWWHTQKIGTPFHNDLSFLIGRESFVKSNSSRHNSKMKNFEEIVLIEWFTNKPFFLWPFLQSRINVNRWKMKSFSDSKRYDLCNMFRNMFLRKLFFFFIFKLCCCFEKMFTSVIQWTSHASNEYSSNVFDQWPL